MQSRAKAALLSTVVLLLPVAAGCGESTGSPAAETETVTVTEPASTPPETAEEPTPAPAAPETVEEPASTSNDTIRVPDVVGEDHQLAQDTMQAAGLYSLDEEDATGQGRMLLYDRNWTVVSQSPAAGTRVTEDRTITLRSKKDGE